MFLNTSPGLNGSDFTFTASPTSSSRLALVTAETREAGFVAPDVGYAAYVGRTGTAETQLRPSGKALVGDDLLDVVTDGELIPKGTPLRVVRVEGVRIIVEARETGGETA